MFPVVRSSLVFSGFGLKPLASGFQSYSSNSLKTSPSIQHLIKRCSSWILFPFISLWSSCAFKTFSNSFRRQWTAFLVAWCPLLVIRSCFVEFCSEFKWSFDEFVGEKVISPSYSSAILAPPSEFQFRKMKKVLQMDSVDGCTTKWMNLIPLNIYFKMINVVKLCISYNN